MGQTTLFNVLQHYNPTLLGGSSGSTIPGSMQSPTAGFNFATVGASIKDADEQAKKLVEALRYCLSLLANLYVGYLRYF